MDGLEGDGPASEADTPVDGRDSDARHPPVDAEPTRYRVPRRRVAEDVEPAEIIRGSQSGSRFARRIRPNQRRFERSPDEGVFTATARATAPRTRAEQLWMRVRRVAVGTPLATEELEEQKLPKWKALAVFSSDVLSSSAYATDEILLVLALAGAAALTYSIEIAGVLVLLLAVVTFSYRQTIRAYPNGGGAYIVARENLGDAAGLSAAAALAVDYVLTVSVSIAAGVLAITSAFPELHDLAIEISVGVVAVITLLNLRGIRESATIFALPTYAFIVSITVLLVGGFIRLLLDPGLQAEIPESVEPFGLSGLSWFIVLKAFASGGAALTGTEAISNGVPAFRRPESRNAATTLIWMAVLLGSFFLGLTILAHELGIQHADEISVPAQIARTVFGETPLFYVIQAATALILLLAANTSYADFPRLGSILARDRFLPHQFTFRGDRLAFSNGIIVLGASASLLLIVFEADVSLLIPLYAFGVFVSFTLSQGGMVAHWLRLRGPGWRTSMLISGVGAVATGVVAAIVGLTKFSEGAWISMLAMAVLALLFWMIHSHYRGVERSLALPLDTIAAPQPPRREVVLVPVEEINRAVVRTIDFARTISARVHAIHVTDDVEAAQVLREDWERTVLDVPLVIIDSPYRSFVAPVVAYVEALNQLDPGTYVAVVLPEIVATWPWQRWLHNQSARRLRKALLERSNTVVVQVPYHLGAGRELINRSVPPR
ncbi:MAG: APC family permease [Dehalococcoidia bacterium]